MKVNDTTIKGLLHIEPRLFADSRGFFYESFQAQRYRKLGIPEFVQDNISHSTAGVLRGLHHQKQHSQGKLVFVSYGQVQDVVVDIRHGSPTFGQSFSCFLDAEKCHQLYLPPGLAHGFLVLSDYASFAYKCTDYYFPHEELTVLWNDPDLAIDWHSNTKPIISEKDEQGKRLRDIVAADLPSYLGVQ